MTRAGRGGHRSCGRVEQAGAGGPHSRTRPGLRRSIAYRVPLRAARWLGVVRSRRAAPNGRGARCDGRGRRNRITD